jgi:hypothetical protein
MSLASNVHKWPGETFYVDSQIPDQIPEFTSNAVCRDSQVRSLGSNYLTLSSFHYVHFPFQLRLFGDVGIDAVATHQQPN